MNSCASRKKPLDSPELRRDDEFVPNLTIPTTGPFAPTAANIRQNRTSFYDLDRVKGAPRGETPAYYLSLSRSSFGGLTLGTVRHTPSGWVASRLPGRTFRTRLDAADAAVLDRLT